MGPNAGILGEVCDGRLLIDCNHLLIAVSGGADSMALLHHLASKLIFREGRPGPMQVSAAHFDHKLRDDSHRDRELVERFCAENDIACHVGSDDVRARAQASGESIEAMARHLRYAFLEATADRIGADLIATAHTRDDQIETILMRILRGSGIRGLAGIPQRRGRIVRPLLSAPRARVLKYCVEESVPYIEDPSNRDTSFERNYIRHEVLPALTTGFPDAPSSLLNVAREAARAVAAIRRITNALLDEHLAEESPGVWTMATPPLSGIDETTAYVLFGDALSYRIRHPLELSRAHHEALYRLLLSDASSQSLPGMTVRREHNHLVFYCGGDPPSRPAVASVTLPLPGATYMRHYRLQAREFSREREDRASWQTQSRGSLESGGDLTSAVAYFAREHVTPPFIVRPAGPGDRMCPFGMGGHQKKLSDLFIDNKIPLRARGNVLVVEDQRRIIWAAGVTTCETTRVTDDTGNVVELLAKIE